MYEGKTCLPKIYVCLIAFFCVFFVQVMPLRQMYPQYLFSDLAAHPGIIYLPYQVSMASLTEQYRMNIPMFFPSKDLLTKWHLEYQIVRQVSSNKGIIILVYFYNMST